MRLIFTGDTVFTGLFEWRKENVAHCHQKLYYFLISRRSVSSMSKDQYALNSYERIILLINNSNVHRFLSMIRTNVLYLINNHILYYDERGLYERRAKTLNMIS